MSDKTSNSGILASADGHHVNSYYAASCADIPSHPTLIEQKQADVCVIGGGFTGLSTALHLAESGKKVILLEAEKISWGASGRNGGHVGVGPRVDQQTLELRHGKDIAHKLWDISVQAVNLVKDLIDKHQIDCDLKQGILHLASKKRDVADMKRGVKIMHTDYAFEQQRFVEKDEVDCMVGSSKFFAGVLDSASYHLHPLKYALGLADACKRAGVEIFEHSRVTGYQEFSNRELALIINTDKGSVNAKQLVLACNGYLDKLEPKMAGKIMPINNFVLATEPLDEQLAKQLIRDDVAIQDSLFVINYWKLSADNRLIFGGGENYTGRFPKQIKAFVRNYMLKIYPQLADVKIDYAWGGTLAITLNRLPHFGRLSKQIYYAQGYSGHGVPTSTLAGKLLAEEICGGSKDFQLISSLPTPGFPGGTLLRWPGLVAGMLYYAFLDRL